MNQPLFRTEVMQARQARWLGGIVLGQAVAPWLLTMCAVLAAVAVAGFLAWGEYTRRTRVSGVLVPSLGIASVAAPAAGILAQVRVEEGQRVLAGDVLAVLSMPRATLRGGDSVQALQAAMARRRQGIADSYASQRRQLLEQGQGLVAQTAGVHAELRQVEAEGHTRRQQQALAEQSHARFRRLLEQRFVTELQIQQQHGLALEQQGQAQALQRQALALRRQLAQLEQQRLELPSRLSALEAAEQRELAALEQESIEAAARAQAVIQAPMTGTIGTVLGRAGQAVQPGQPLLSLLPAASALEAHLLLPSRAVGFVAPGDAVLLRYQAFPYQKFGHHRGRVLRVSSDAAGTGEPGALPARSQGNEATYRVVVALEKPAVRAFGREHPLRPGMALDADILGERRRLWEWAFEPLHALDGVGAR